MSEIKVALPLGVFFNSLLLYPLSSSLFSEGLNVTKPLPVPPVDRPLCCRWLFALSLPLQLLKSLPKMPTGQWAVSLGVSSPPLFQWFTDWMKRERGWRKREIMSNFYYSSSHSEASHAFHSVSLSSQHFPHFLITFSFSSFMCLVIEAEEVENNLFSRGSRPLNIKVWFKREKNQSQEKLRAGLG